MLQRFNENRWQPLTTFPLNVSSRGSGADIATSSHWGSTLIGNKISNLYDYFKYIFFKIPAILGSYSHVICNLVSLTYCYLRYLNKYAV